MNTNKLDKAFSSKYELYDINHKRLLPKEIVAFRKQSTLGKGIIISVNPKTTSIITLSDNKRTYNAHPNEQIIITDLIEDKEQYYQLFEQVSNTRKQKTFVRCVPCLMVDTTKSNTDLEKYKLLILYYKLNVGNNSTKNWNVFLNNIKSNKLFDTTNYDLYVFCNDNYFYDLYTTKYKDINYVSNNNSGRLLYDNTEYYGYCCNNVINILHKAGYITFPIDKECNLWFNPIQLTNMPINTIFSSDRRYITFDKKLYYISQIYIKYPNTIFEKSLNEIMKKYEH